MTNFFRQLIVYALFFIAGAAAMQMWHLHQARQDKALLDTLTETDSVFVRDMTNAAEPDGVSDTQAPQMGAELTVPSQLSKIDVPDVQTVLPRSGAEFVPNAQEETEQTAALPVLDDSARVAVGTAIQTATAPAPAQPVAADSKISMIEVPVEAVVIKSLDEYRDFKRRARGSYPEVDFEKQDVLVLESASNLPDKVFEIQTVADDGGKRIVTYRVSVFGLDKKTNTHSVAVADKSNLPIELKQVL